MLPSQRYRKAYIEAREKTVGDRGASGRIYVSKSWIGKKVVIILKEEKGK